MLIERRRRILLHLCRLCLLVFFFHFFFVHLSLGFHLSALRFVLN